MVRQWNSIPITRHVFRLRAKELQKAEAQVRNNALAAEFTNANIRWRFFPSAAPHMGGVWERLVRSIKKAIGAVVDAPRKPTDEVLETILLQAESMINTRPLTYIPLESSDQEALTPNQFLLWLSNGDKIPPEESIDSPAVLRNSWKLAQIITNELWSRWVNKYLPVMRRRGKWFEECRDIAVGDLVLVVSGTARNQWIRGRVEDVIPGRDGRIRQAVARTASGVLRRPAVKRQFPTF